MDGNIDKTTLAMSLWLLKLGDGYMGVHYAILINFAQVQSDNIKSLIIKSLNKNIFQK